MADNTSRADWLAPYAGDLLFPATSIAIEIEGPENPMCAPIAEALDFMVTLILCMRLHGNDKAALKACARLLHSRSTDVNNKVFLCDVMRAFMPDAVIRTRLKELAQQDNKAQRQMVRDGVWPEWMGGKGGN